MSASISTFVRPTPLWIGSPSGTRMVHNLRYFAITLMLLIALSFTFERQAHAYVDPGSGLLIFQGLSAAPSVSSPRNCTMLMVWWCSIQNPDGGRQCPQLVLQ